MHVPNRALKRIRAALLPSTAALSIFVGTLALAGGAQAGPITKCPTAAAVSSDAGVKLTGGHAIASGGTLLCSYTYKTYGSLQLLVAKVPGVDVSIFKLLTVKAAAEEKGKVKVLSGIGSAAFEYTNPDVKSEVDGIATTTVSVLAGAIDVTVSGDLPASSIVAIAKRVS